MSVALALLCALSAQAAAAVNLWESRFGQRWFFESRSSSGQTLAGTWWEAALTPGTTYTISFEVNHLQGGAGLHVGAQPMISINRTGWHSYDFKVWQGSERRMMFTALGNDVTVGVRAITVQPKWGDSGTDSGGGSGGDGSGDGSGGTGTGGAGNWMPKGHYWSFAEKWNLKTEMYEIMISKTRKAPSNWHLGMAQELHTALTTPGVKGYVMRFNWGDLETGDGRYNWALLDANMDVARRMGLRMVVQIGYRSFDGSNPLPGYFPSQYRIWANGGGKGGYVAKLWDPWVYSRLIRLYKQIGWRYQDNPGFGGVGTSETALGNLSGGNYSYWQYRTALQKIATETQAALKRGRFFLYMNFLPGGDNYDMRVDGKVSLVNSIPHYALVIGGPDILPDAWGMPGYLTGYRIHMRKTRPGVEQFCNAQHADQGLGGLNRKNNAPRKDFIERVKRVRERERQSWFKGQPAIFEFDDLRAPNGTKVDLHPDWVLGQQWNPWELFSYAKRNFDCDYFLWHFRTNVYNWPNQFWWQDVRPVIINNQNF